MKGSPSDIANVFALPIWMVVGAMSGFAVMGTFRSTVGGAVIGFFFWLFLPE